jgi:lactam utilization protein B
MLDTSLEHSRRWWRLKALLIVLRYPPPLIIQVHGALYFMLRDDPALLRAFLRAHVSLSPSDPIPFFGLAGTAHEAICKEMGVPFVPELFVDIDYNSEGRLLSVPESKVPTEQGIKDKMARILNDRESESVRVSPGGPTCTAEQPPSL